LPALWTVGANFGDHLHFGSFAQTGTTKACKMGNKESVHMPFTRRTLAADVKTLEANSNFFISENKKIQKRVG